MPDPVELQVEYSKLDYSAFSNVMRRSGRHKFLAYIVALLGALALYFVFTVLTILVSRWNAPDDPDAQGYFSGSATLTAFLFAAIYVLFTIFRKQKHRRALQNSPMAQGLTELRLDEKGVSTRNPLGSRWLAWPAITGVFEGAPGIVLALDKVQYIPVPTSSLPDELDKAELIRRIKAWREAAAMGES